MFKINIQPWATPGGEKSEIPKFILDLPCFKHEPQTIQILYLRHVQGGSTWIHSLQHCKCTRYIKYKRPVRLIDFSILFSFTSSIHLWPVHSILCIVHKLCAAKFIPFKPTSLDSCLVILYIDISMCCRWYIPCFIHKNKSDTVYTYICI